MECKFFILMMYLKFFIIKIYPEWNVNKNSKDLDQLAKIN
ncbi:hypothetical protein HMPREF0391_10927 [Finegoldia magna ATCC 53516]|uniref:Uncharacterized protein n=1 Tax=Finegoldia magna ATCC 53516 TaxID=525282 RepID=D6S8Z1_FINMA|nr:hypothetical protein HMPREF0391_10927 [Finegoldia magna ATCC 53516]